MNLFNELCRKSLLYHLWQEIALRYRFKYVLPRVREIELDGLKLDVSRLPVKIRNRMLTGLYEMHEKKMCCEFLNPDDAVLELGGAIGFIGLLCQKKIGVRRYYSCEANPRTVELMKANYLLNGLEPQVWNVALADAAGSVELDVGGDFWENSIVALRDGEERRETVEVPAMTFEQLLEETRGPVNVLIIDIEGAEQFIDFTAIPAAIDKIIIELHPKVIGQAMMYDIVAALIQGGFYVAREEEGIFAFLRAGTGRTPRKAETQVAAGAIARDVA